MEYGTGLAQAQATNEWLLRGFAVRACHSEVEVLRDEF